MDLTITIPDRLHADSRELLGRFTTALAEKMRASEEKHGYANHWMRGGWIADGRCIRHFSEHVLKGDPRDVAIYAAFLWHHGASTTFVPPAKNHSCVSGAIAGPAKGNKVATAQKEPVSVERLLVANLADHPEHISTVATWLFEEWGETDGFKTVADTEYRTRHALGRTAFPMTLVGLIDGIPVATVSVWPSDLQARQDLGPWAAGLFVDRAARGHGIGAAMIAGACVEAARVGATQNLYLHTAMEGYYELFGWEFVETAPRRGHRTRIYRYGLKAMNMAFHLVGPGNERE